ncbi:hypothetical protein D6C79_09297 [Aureobasidium pullulans]|nr:hypothetical protein D6C79_09297 [Aureobasidium pullulans]
MTCFSVLTPLAAVVALSPLARPTVSRWQTAPAAPMVLALRSVVVPATSTAAPRAAEEAEGEANRGCRREEEELATLFRLPLLTRPLPTTPVVTQFSRLRSRLFPCASTAHTTSATWTRVSLLRPAVPRLYACPKSFQTSARTSTEGSYTES